MTGRNVITAVQWASPRAHFRTSQVHRGVWQLHASQRRRRRAKNGREDIGAFLNHLVGAFVPMFGVLSQELDRIGANGFMVLQLRVSCLHGAGSCRQVRRALRKSG